MTSKASLVGRIINYNLIKDTPLVPLAVVLGAEVQKVTAGVSHSVFLSGDKRKSIRVMGSNYFGQAGFFPALAGGIFESGDDTLAEPLHLEEGIKEVTFADIATGDYHNLAQSVDGKIFGWGAGLLGNGSPLFSSEPVRVSPDGIKAKLIAASKSRSLFVADDDAVFLWGYERDINDKIVGWNLKPAKLNVKRPGEISACSLTDHLVALKVNQSIVVIGACVPSSQGSLQYPYNPEYADLKESASFILQEELVLETSAKDLIDFQISGNYLYTLSRKGQVDMIDLVKGTNHSIPGLKGKIIKQMSIGTISACFLEYGDSKTIYTFAGKLSKKKEVPFLSLFAHSFSPSSNSDTLIPGIPLHEALMYHEAAEVKSNSGFAFISSGFGRVFAVEE